MKMISRKDVINKLKEWQDHKISATDIQDWVCPLYPGHNVDYEDWINDESAIREVLSQLDMLDMNLIISDDAQMFIDLLKTPIADFQLAFANYKKSQDKINIEDRKTLLKDKEPYTIFCK